jgi:enoyl-CoA hydratase/carnithine racemase
VTLSLDLRLPVAILTFGRGDGANRLDRRTITELREAVERLASDSTARAVVITGLGSVFSLGWDTDVLDAGSGAAVETPRQDDLGHTFQFLADSPLPVIAAINGDALSAGLELALACDLRVASTKAKLGLPEVAGGRIPMGGGTQRLARIAGRTLALEMILTAEPIDAMEALESGLVSALRLPGEVLDGACQLATSIAQRGPLAVRLAKEAVLRGLDMTIEQGLRFETDLTILLQTTADRAEGVSAFKERRSPEFHGH